MIVANFLSKSGKLIGFKVCGHSDYDESGKDIVCASVSSAVQLVCNTITECFKSDAEISVDKVQGICLTLTEHSNSGDNSSILLIEGLKLHLETLVKEFSGNIKVKITEV